jgi:hypothetical protein
MLQILIATVVLAAAAWFRQRREERKAEYDATARLCAEQRRRQLAL